MTKPKGGRQAVERVLFTARVTRAWREWLAELADHCRTRSIDVIDQALIRHAKEVGFEKKAPRR